MHKCRLRMELPVGGLFAFFTYSKKRHLVVTIRSVIWTTTLQQSYFKYDICICDFFLILRGMEAEREREKHQCERETPIRCLLYVPPRLGIDPTTSVGVLNGDHDILVSRDASAG